MTSPLHSSPLRPFAPAAYSPGAEAEQVRLGPTSTPLEARALTAHAQRLGLTVGADGAVDLDRADGLFRGPRGGAEAVRRAAAHDAASDRLSLDEVRTLQRGRLAELFAPGGGEAAARANLTGATAGLESTADQLLALGDRVRRRDFADDDAPITALRRMAARATKAAGDLDRALDSATLAFASPEQLERLTAAYGRVTGALGHLDGLFSSAGGPSGLDRLLFHVKESYGSDYGAIEPQTKVMQAGEALRAAVDRVRAHAPAFARADAAR